MKKHRFILTVSLCAVGLAGCARFHSVVTETTDKNGVTKRETMVKAGTLFDSKSELAKLSSGQTGAKQEVAIGSLRQQSEGSNAVNFAEGVVGAAVRAAVGK